MLLLNYFILTTIVTYYFVFFFYLNEVFSNLGKSLSLIKSDSVGRYFNIGNNTFLNGLGQYR